jgi:DNA-binding IclR family transcriptional regulator
MPGASEPAANQGIERTAAVLRALRKASRSGTRLTDIATATGLSKSTAHRLLNGLMQVGFVEHDEATGLFHLGFDLFVIGAAAANRHGIAEIARPSLVRLESRTGDTVFLSVRSGVEAICIDRVEGSFPIKALTLNVGDRRPLGVGAGSLALLAFLPDSDIEQIVEGNAARLSAFPGYTPSLLYDMVEAARRQGYTLNDGHVLADMFAVGMPVMGRNQRPLASLSIAAIKGRIQGDRRANLVGWLRTEAQALEQRIATLMEGLSDTEASRFGHPDHARR